MDNFVSTIALEVLPLSKAISLRPFILSAVTFFLSFTVTFEESFKFGPTCF